MSEDGSEIGDDVDPLITSIISADEMLKEGLLLAGFSLKKQERQPKSNLKDFKDRYGSSPIVLCCIWEDLQTVDYELARVPKNKLNLKHYLQAHHFLKQYPTESEQKSMYQQRTQTMRDNVWYYVEKIRALKHLKIFIPEDHITGDDIWICTVDGTMSVSNERAGKDQPKDPAIFSFKHHAAGYNSEIAVSIKESRCIWVNGGHDAGSGTDRVLFRQPGGLRDTLKQYKKKGIADGGYTGDDDVLSTPNGHDDPSVRKFKSRALKRHEKFNSMLKVFKCLGTKFRHTASDEERYACCLEACAVICQYQMENGSPLFNIYVGDM
jgi:hypothetical protein